MRDHKVLHVQPGRDVGGRQWHGCDKKTKPVEVDRQTEGKIVSFSLLHRESCFQPVVFPDSAVEATTSFPNLKKKILGHFTKNLRGTTNLLIVVLRAGRLVRADSHLADRDTYLVGHKSKEEASEAVKSI